MEEYIGQVCPFCKNEIKEGEAVKVCPACNTPHHEACWEDNKGCAIIGCSEHHEEDQVMSTIDESSENGVMREGKEEFCSDSGTPMEKEKKAFCVRCGAELEEGHVFCPKCGHKAGSSINTSESHDAGSKSIDKKKKMAVIIGAIGAVAVIVILLLTLGGGSKFDFSKKYGELSSETWCTIGSDGTWMRLDTNPDDYDEEYLRDLIFYTTLVPCNQKIEDVLKDLGFSSAVHMKMDETTWSQGRQTESNDKFAVSWTYHPDKGLEVMFEVKNK